MILNSKFSENVFSDAGFFVASSSSINISSTNFTAFKLKINFLEKFNFFIFIFCTKKQVFQLILCFFSVALHWNYNFNHFKIQHDDDIIL